MEVPGIRMTFAILAWQLVIFFSICMARRWRAWMIAFWVVWTLLQVAAFSLSVIQFATIFAAIALSKPAKTNTAPTARLAEKASSASSEPNAISIRSAEEATEHIAVQISAPTPPSSRTTLDKLLRPRVDVTQDHASHLPKVPQVGRASTEALHSSPSTRNTDRQPYVTRSTFFNLSSNRLELASAPTDEVLLPLLYGHTLHPFFNSSELRALLVLKTMFMGTGDLKALPARKQPRYVFKINPPKFHMSKDCEYLHAPFANYLVPAEIAVLGEEKIGEFQQFCQENRARFNGKADHVFWAHVSAHFQIQIQPQPVRHSNSGVQRVDRRSVASIALAIDDHYAALANAMEDPIHGHVVKRLRYAAPFSAACRTIKDQSARDFMEAFYTNKKALADLLFDLYRHQAGVDDYQLPLDLLKKLGLQACKGCH